MFPCINVSFIFLFGEIESVCISYEEKNLVIIKKPLNNPPLSLYIELNIFASPFNEDKVYISSQRKHAPLRPYYKKTYFIVFTKVSWDIHLPWYYETFVSKVIYKKYALWHSDCEFCFAGKKTSFLVYLKSLNNSHLVLNSISWFLIHIAGHISRRLWY